MKAIQARGRGVEWLFLAFTATGAFYWLHPSDGRFAGWLIVGAVWVVVQIGGHPDRWRTRSGSLVPAACLVAISGFAAGIATVLAFGRLH